MVSRYRASLNETFRNMQCSKPISSLNFGNTHCAPSFPKCEVRGIRSMIRKVPSVLTSDGFMQVLV